MTKEEAKELFKKGNYIYRAYYEGSVWSAGRMVDVGETIGYFLTNEEAEKACDDYELIDFDKEHCYTDVVGCDENDFEE